VLNYIKEAAECQPLCAKKLEIFYMICQTRCCLFSHLIFSSSPLIFYIFCLKDGKTGNKSRKKETIQRGGIIMETQVIEKSEKNSKLLKGVILGGIIGGALTLLDSSTRNKVKTTAVDLKDSSMDMISQVKENPGELKEQMVQRFKDASNTLKEAISEAQNLYQVVNEDVLGKVNEVKDISSDALSTAMDATGELKEISSKVVEAGSKLTDSSSAATSQTNGKSSSSSKISSVSVNSTGNKSSVN
jgi:gas vesicle protein